METPEGDSNLNVLQPAMNQQNGSSLDGPVAILWDIENCRVPNEVWPEDVAGNIRMALQGHPVTKGAVKMFSAYGDFHTFSKRLREGCHRTGVKLIDVPNGRKDAADKAILIDMFVFALDNPPPSSILLISGDVDFAPALHTLGQRGYMVIVVIPSDRHVSSALCNAGKFVWDWPSVARGEGFVPHILPSRVIEVSGCLVSHDDNDTTSAQDINGLKEQLVKLLESSGGSLLCSHVRAEYKKMFGRPLDCKDYGRFKLRGLIKKMGDTMAIHGKGEEKVVYLRNWKASPNVSPVLERKEKRGKGTQEENMGFAPGGDYFCNCLDEERMAVEGQDDRRNPRTISLAEAAYKQLTSVFLQARKRGLSRKTLILPLVVALLMAATTRKRW